MNKLDNAYKSISEVAKLLNLINSKNGKPNTHTIRFWEKKFTQLKPKKLAGNRRYYDQNTILVLKKIKYLLKEKGLTIKGAKKIAEKEISKIEGPLFHRKDIGTSSLIQKRIEHMDSLR